ncbi:MAG: YfhO family protein [Lagierella massiliensis]|nr:YfhO family protein [Lagierella massiliensis]
MKEFYNKLRDNKHFYFVIAFLIPFFTFIITYIAYMYYPIGSGQILIVDAYHQYYQFFLVLREKFLNGGGFFYTFSMGLGSDFIGLIAYYLMSPFNIFLIAIPEDYVIVFFEFLIAIKVGLMGLTASIYLYNIYHKRTYSLVAFSLIYSLCGFICGYYWNIMWLDVLIIFPLTMLGVKNIVNRNSFRLYFFCLMGTFLFNYYMSIFVVISIVLFYFGYNIILGTSFKIIIKKGFKTLYYSIFAALLSSFLLIPTAIGLTKVYKTPQPFNENIKLINDFKELLANILAFNSSTVRDGLPNIYSGLLIILFFFIFFFAKGILRREKVLVSFYILFLYLSTNINVLDYIWHGFRYSNMLPSRFTFILSFMIMILSYKTYINIESINLKTLIVFGLTSLGIVFYLGLKRPWQLSVINLILLTIYILIIYLILSKYKNAKLIFNLVLTLELVVNGFVGLNSGGSTDYYEFTEYKDEMAYLQAATSNEEFTRFESMDRFTFNDPALYGYNGLSLFSSTLDKRVSIFLEKMGHSSSPSGNRIYYNYTTPVINSFLNIGYLYEKDNFLDLFGFETYLQSNKVRLLKNKYALPLAFEAKGDIYKDNFKYDNIENQQNLFSVLTGEEEDIFSKLKRVNVESENIELRNSYEDKIFFILPEETGSLFINYKIAEDGYYYFDSDHIKDDKFTIISSGSNYTFDIKNKNIVGGIPFKKGDKVTVKVNIDNQDQGKFSFRVFKLNEKAFLKGIEKTLKNGAKNVRINKENVSFEIDSQSGNIVTSIPYSEGWKVYVNGKETNAIEFYDSFIRIDGKPGKNYVELKYMSEGFKEGMLISFTSLFLLAILKRRSLKELVGKGNKWK